MHELSLVQGIVDIVKQEMENHGLTKLLKVRVKYGRLAQVVPDALQMGWEVMTNGTPFAGAELELEEIPLRVACCKCATEFSPVETEGLLMTCPSCGEDFGHKVLSGREFYLDEIEAE